MTQLDPNHWSGKRVLISGGTGFIGSEVVDQLTQLNAQVGVISRSQPNQGAVQWIKAGDSSPFPSDETKHFNPEIIIHLATQFAATHTRADINSLVTSNIEFGTQLLESAAQVDATFVNVSSSWQHFDGREYSPVSLYAATKQAFLDIAQYYSETGLDFRNLTIYDTYGPTDQRNKLVSQLLTAAVSGRSIAMGSGEQLINLLAVEDIISALLLISTLPAPDESDSLDYVVRAPESISIRQIVEVIQQVTGKKIDANWGSRPPRAREMTTDWIFGTMLPGWKQTVPLHEGLQSCWQEVSRAT
jgi:nucleoside-diphosphate-sugar epimerase